MPTPTYDALASTTLTLPAISVTFSSLDTIAAGYRDLVLVVNGGENFVYGLYRIRFNGDTGSNYSFVSMSGNGSSTYSASNTQTSLGLSTAFAQTSQNYLAITQIMDFSATDKHKSVLHRGNDAATGVDAFSGRWANTNAITTVEITTASLSTFAAGSTFSLYGIAAV